MTNDNTAPEQLTEAEKAAARIARARRLRDEVRDLFREAATVKRFKRAQASK